MVAAHYIKLFQMGSDRHNSILMSSLLLVAETIIVSTYQIGNCMIYSRFENALVIRAKAKLLINMVVFKILL